jgi:hypothetical protein
LDCAFKFSKKLVAQGRAIHRCAKSRELITAGTPFRLEDIERPGRGRSTLH